MPPTDHVIPHDEPSADVIRQRETQQDRQPECPRGDRRSHECRPLSDVHKPRQHEGGFQSRYGYLNRGVYAS